MWIEFDDTYFVAIKIFVLKIEYILKQKTEFELFLSQ